MHRWTTQSPKAPPLPAQVYDDVKKRVLTEPHDKARFWARGWNRIWNPDDLRRTRMLQQLNTLIRDARSSEPLERITADMVQEAAKKIRKDTALGIDFMEVWLLRGLSHEQANAVAELLNECEAPIT